MMHLLHFKLEFSFFMITDGSLPLLNISIAPEWI